MTLDDYIAQLVEMHDNPPDDTEDAPQIGYAQRHISRAIDELRELDSIERQRAREAAP